MCFETVKQMQPFRIQFLNYPYMSSHLWNQLSTEQKSPKMPRLTVFLIGWDFCFLFHSSSDWLVPFLLVSIFDMRSEQTEGGLYSLLVMKVKPNNIDHKCFGPISGGLNSKLVLILRDRANKHRSSDGKWKEITKW